MFNKSFMSPLLLTNVLHRHSLQFINASLPSDLSYQNKFATTIKTDRKMDSALVQLCQ